MKLSLQKIKKLKEISKQLRINILNTIFRVKKGHIGGSFSCIDILICIYISNIFNFSKIDFQKKNK